MPLRDDLLNPIPGDNPGGANLRYDPVTDKIKEARREDLDVPQGEWKTALKTADYNQVVKLAGDAIANRSKDLQLAVWLVDAHVRKEGFGLLAPSFHFLRDFLEQFWDSLYPPIDEDGDMEVRAAPLEWLGGKLGEPLGFLPLVSGKLSWVSYQESRVVGYENDADTTDKQDLRQARIAEGKLTAEQFDEALEATSLDALKNNREHLTDALTALESLIECCDTRFGDFSPSFLKTRGSIEDILQTVKLLIGRKPGGSEEEAQPDEAEEPSSWSAEEDSVRLGVPAAPESAAAVAPAREPVETKSPGRQLATICRAMRAQDPEDPAPYLILRSFAWARLQQNAPLIDYAAIEAPPGDLRITLKRATADSDWDRVIELTENAMLLPCAGYWLDLQRYAVNAIEHKGFPATARVVNNCLRVLLEAQPDLVEVTLPDDTPAANAETKNWIQNNVIIQRVPRERGDQTGGTPSSDDSSSTDFSSTDFSFDSSTTTEESTDSSTDFSFDSEPSLETTGETTVETTEPAEEPKEFVMDENPPILEDESAPNDISDEFTQALRAIRKGTTEDGLQIITALLATERSGRARFRRRTQLAHLLLTAGKGAVALPILDQIAGEIEERRLEDWEESEALAYPLDLLLQCLGRADAERKAALYARICKLDPVRALRSSP